MSDSTPAPSEEKVSNGNGLPPELRQVGESSGKLTSRIEAFAKELTASEAKAREAEVAAVQAFRVGHQYERSDIVEELNRLSSALHVMMCMYLAGQYQ